MWVNKSVTVSRWQPWTWPYNVHMCHTGNILCNKYKQMSGYYVAKYINFPEILLIHVSDWFQHKLYQSWSEKNVVRSCSIIVKGHQYVAVWTQNLWDSEQRKEAEKAAPLSHRHCCHWKLTTPAILTLVSTTKCNSILTIMMHFIITSITMN